MIKLLTLILSLVDRMLSAWADAKRRDEGRQQAFKEMNDAINRQIELGGAAVNVPDPVRDERLRARFDAAAR